MLYTKPRDFHYLFTVKNDGVHSENFFKLIRDRAHSRGMRVHRWGRLRDRKSVGVSRERGHVPLAKCDRWDLYFESDLQFLGRSFLWFIRPEILLYRSGIQYANVVHKAIIEEILEVVNDKIGNDVGSKSKSVDLTKVQITPEAIKMTKDVLNKAVYGTPVWSTWKVNLKSEVMVRGETCADLVKTLMEMGFSECDLVSYEKIDQHKDLPLVRFDYPEHGAVYGPLSTRSVRVVKMDKDSIEGYEHGTFKKFLQSKVVGKVEVVEIPQKES